MNSKLDPQTVTVPKGTKVSSLIINRRWNELVIRNVFLPHVVNEILSIPLSNTMVGNARFWKFEPKGKFTVRGGYV